MRAPRLHYILGSHKPTREEVIRIVEEIKARAASRSRNVQVPREEEVHEIRLLIKRLRALLWFARPALGKRFTSSAQAHLRKAAEILAGARDSVVVLKTLEALKRELPAVDDRLAVVHVHRCHKERVRMTAAPRKEHRQTFQKATGLLCRTTQEIVLRSEDASDWPTLRHRMEKAGKQMNRAGHLAHHTKSDVDFHTWRKKTKRFHYLQELAGARSSSAEEKNFKLIDELQSKLGDYHDFIVAEHHVRDADPRPSSARRVLNLLAAHKKRLRKKVRLVAARLDAD